MPCTLHENIYLESNEASPGPVSWPCFDVAHVAQTPEKPPGSPLFSDGLAACCSSGTDAVHLLITSCRSEGRSGKDLIYTRGLGIYVRWNYFNLVMGSTERRGQAGGELQLEWKTL